MIDIGTHALHTRVLGEGSPAVVVDVGIAARSEEWYPLQERLAEETLVFLYDRAGYGTSEPGPLPRDSGREMDELKNLLQASSIAGPYVLVGHSLGALNLQVFAARYPEDVAGLVLLDPPPLGWLLGESYPDLLTMAERMTVEWQAIADLGSESSDPEEKAMAAFFRMIASEHREMLRESARLVAEIETFGDTPLAVIASGVPNPVFGNIAEEYQMYWADQSRALAGKSSRGKFLLAEDSSHRLHEEATDLVLDGILSVMAETVKSSIDGNSNDKDRDTTLTTDVRLHWKDYTDREQGFQLQYPDCLLVASKKGGFASFRHSIPCEHIDPCDFDDDVAILKELVDFHIKFEIWRYDLRRTVESTSTDFIITRYLQGDTLQIEPGFIDKVRIGSLEGNRITSGVEGCGEYDYYFPLQENVTLHVKRVFITEFNPILKNYIEYLSLPGIIKPNEEIDIFKRMLSTVKLLK